MRRKIHTFAEVGGEEYKTSQLVCHELEVLDIPYEKVTQTALMAIMDTGRTGPTIAFRADMDALPMKENLNNLVGPRTCVSEQEGTCHACGHDAHTAMLLGSIQVLHQLKEKLVGRLIFCFEAGEECGKSVKQILEGLEKLKPDTVWAIHVYSGLESGKISVEAGPRMAGGAGVGIQVNGRGGHGSRPDKSINPVYAAANIVTNIPGTFVNQLDVEKTVTFGITTIMGGGTANIFPSSAEITGSLRFFDTKEGEKAIALIKKVAEHTAALNDCRVEFAPTTKVLIAPVMNDEGCVKLAQEGIKEIYPQGIVAKCSPWYASESFSRYTQIYPSVLAFLGISNLEYGSGAEHHNEYFDIDEKVLKIGVMSTVKYAMKYIESYV